MGLGASIAWLAWIGSWVAGRPAAWAPDAWTSPWHPTLALVGIETIIIAVGALNDLCLRRLLLGDELARLCEPNQGALRYEAAYDQARTEHLVQLPGLAYAAVDIVYVPLALVAGTMLVLQLGGGGGDLIVASLTSVLAALALSRWISTRRADLALPMAAARKRRLSLVGQWLSRRPNPLSVSAVSAASQVGPVGQFEHIGHDDIGQQTWCDDAIVLLDAAEAQTELAMRDSIWRNLEAFLHAHCIALPLAGLAVASALAHAGPASFALAWAWAMLPVVDVALSAWRPVAGLGAANITLHKLELGFASAPANDDSGPLLWHEGWRLFDGSMLDNMDPQGQARQLAGFMMAQLRLDDELRSSTCEDAASFVVEADGRNLTASQRCRVLFARAALEAIRTPRALIIDTSMAALDHDARKHLEAAACALRVPMIWGPGSELTTHECSGATQVARPAGAGHAIDLPAALRRSVALAPVFALSIAGLFLLSAIVLNHEADLPRHWAITALTVASVSFALATRAGFRLERAERLHALDEHARLLAHPPTCNRSWLVRRLTTDFDSIIGGTTARIRQLVWLGIATCACIVAILWAAGATGAAAMAGTSVAGVFLHTALARWHREAVVATRQGFAAFVAETDNLKRLDGLTARAACALRRTFVRRGFEHLGLARSRAAISKAIYGELLLHLPSLAALVLVSTIALPIDRTDTPPHLTAIAFGGLIFLARAAGAMVRQALDDREMSR